MDEQQREEFVARVRKAIEEVSEEVSRLKELTKSVQLDSSIGRLTRMDAIRQKSIKDTSLRSAEGRLLKLKRLLAAPESRFCAGCVRK